MKFSGFLVKRAFSVLSLLMLMLLFQNCGISEEGTSLSEYEERRASELPFAFDFNVDHIAYMSCEGENLRLAPAYFNFKAGAYNDGSGVRFSSNFLEKIGDLATNKETLLRYLANSENNQGTGVIMSLREGDLRAPLTVEASVPKEQALSPMVWDASKNVTLTQTKIASYIYDNPQGVNYLKGFSGLTGKAFEASLSFDKVGVQIPLRASLEGAGYLSFTYATEDLEAPGMLARSPYDATGEGATEATRQARSSIFGKGYKMNFGQFSVPFESTRTSAPRVVVTGITGVQLENDNVSLDENWVCPANERYIIVKGKEDAMLRFDGAPATVDHDNDPNTAALPNNPWETYYNDGGKGVGGYYVETLVTDIYDEDNDGNDTESVRLKRKVLCPMIPDQMNLSQSEHNDPAWQRIRKILSPDEWYVYRGDRYNCIVPKKDNGSSCYGKVSETTGNNGPRVMYFSSYDFVGERLDDNKRVEDGIARGVSPTPVHNEFDPITDCEGANTGNAKCPHILSVCYKL